jgi:hypothetical protein
MRKFFILTLAVFTIAFGQVTLQVTAPASLEQVNIADLDVSRLKDLPLLFTVTITSDTTRILKLHFQVFAKIGNEPEDIFADAWSLPFEVTRDRILSFTNQDLASGKVDIKSDKDRTKIYEDKIKKIKDLAQSTGRLPAGSYRFVIQLLDKSELGILSTWEKVYEITNPSRIDLVSPSYESEVRTQFPIFKWIAPNFKEFEIFVYEKLPNQTTPEEVVSGDKNLRWRYQTTESQVQYPREALPLENGKSYYWYVKSTISGSRGIEEIRSEIWNFTVNLGPATTETVISKLTPTEKKTLDNLISAFKQAGNQEIAELLSKIVSDLVIMIDGRPATPGEIEEILRAIRQQLAELGAEVEVK